MKNIKLNSVAISAVLGICKLPIVQAAIDAAIEHEEQQLKQVKENWRANQINLNIDEYRALLKPIDEITE